jgi:hypothetical protein
MAMPSSYRCERCDAQLVEHQPNARWLRWWECSECYRAYHLEVSRTLKPRTDDARVKYFAKTWVLAIGIRPRLDIADTVGQL